MKALLVIDMLNDFCHSDGSLYFPGGERVIPEVKKVIDKFIQGEPDGYIYFICDSHPIVDKEFERFPVHCVRDTWGADVVNELKKYTFLGSDVDVPKRRYSGFFNTGLANYIKDCDEVWVVGVCTDICVLFTVEELCNRDIRTIVFKNAVSSFNDCRHDFALELMEDVLGADVVHISQVICASDEK